MAGSDSHPLVETFTTRFKLLDDKEDYKTYTGYYGDLCVVARVQREGEVIIQRTIPHPYVQQRWGTTGLIRDKKYIIEECIQFDLQSLLKDSAEQLLEKYTLQPGTAYLSILFQTIFGLDGIRADYQCAHGKLTADNVAIQVLPHQHTSPIPKLNVLCARDEEYPANDKGPKLVVKLRGFSGSIEGTNESYAKDLISFGKNLIQPFLKQRVGGIRSEEGKDLLMRIFNSPWENDYLCSGNQRESLSHRLHSDFAIHASLITEHPFFKDSSTALKFFGAVATFLDKYYHNHALGFRKKDPNFKLAPAIKDFITDLQKLDCSGWKDELDYCVRKNCAKSTSFFGYDDEDSILGLIKGIRNSESHWGVLDVNDLNQIGCSTDIYEYFRSKFPRLYIHIYTCLQLHYQMLQTLDGSLDIYFKRYVSSACRGL